MIDGCGDLAHYHPLTETLNMAESLLVTIENFDATVVAELRTAQPQLGPTAPAAGATVAVAWHAGVAAGCALLSPTAEPTHGAIHSLYVHPDLADPTLERTLLARLEACAQEKGYRTLQLTLAKQQPDAARFATACGYQPTPGAAPNHNGTGEQLFTKRLILIRQESPLHPNLAALFAAKLALSRSLYPAESDYSFSPADLARPDILFLVADDHGEFVGCGAAVPYAAYGEIKSMFVNAEVRGQRIGERIMLQLESYLRACGKSVSYLETGVVSHGALRLYTRLGYTRRGPYGNYADDPLCVFMEKAL